MHSTAGIRATSSFFLMLQSDKNPETRGSGSASSYRRKRMWGSLLWRVIRFVLKCLANWPVRFGAICAGPASYCARRRAFVKRDMLCAINIE
jgi:hypothetical protein